MQKIKKIIVNKSDEAAVVVEKIIDAEADEIVLNIPRFSKLAESLANFHLIKRESDLLNKKIIIESVDDGVVETAGLAKLEAVNPFFIKSRRISDIVAKAQEPSGKKRIAPPSPSDFEPPRPPKERSSAAVKPSFRRIGAVLIFAAAAAAVLMLGIKILPRANIVIVTQKLDWQYNDSVIADKSVLKIEESKPYLPAQLFSQSKNLQLSFPASGKKKIERRASGQVVIYNAYSSEPQPLVATTRFVTPDGKIFRLVNSLTVPGAKIAEGKIVPSAIEAGVIADKPGDSYNIGPVSRFIIPGFKGTPKFEAFYAESKEPMTGGFIGEVAFPSDNDLKTAKSELSKKLEDALTASLISQIPADFKLIDGAKQIVFNQQKIIEEAAASGNFGIFGEAVGTVIAFRETDLLEMMKTKVKKDIGDDFEIKEFNLQYGEARADFVRGRMSFPVKFSSKAAKAVNPGDFKARALNKSEADLKALIFSTPGIESARISLWPFWVKKVPSNPNRVKVTVE